MTSQKLEKINQRIAAMKSRLELIERFRDEMAADPSLLDIFAESDGSSEPTADKGRVKKTEAPKALFPSNKIGGGPKAANHFRKVSEFLESKNNEPHAIPEIAKATGLPSSAVIQLAYRSHQAAFESHPVAGHKTRKTWSLRKNWKAMVNGE